MDFVPWDEPQVTKKGQRVSGFQMLLFRTMEKLALVLLSQYKV